MNEKVLGYIIWKDATPDMLPLVQNKRLVLFSQINEAIIHKDCLDVVSPATGGDIRQIVRKYSLHGIQRGLDDEEETRSTQSHAKPSKAKAKLRKAAQPNAKPKQMQLF